MNKLFQAEIIDYIKQNDGTETAELQKKFGISYRDAKLIVAELLSKGDLVYAGGVKYTYVGKPDPPQADSNLRPEPRRIDFDSGNRGGGGISSSAKRLAMLQARRNELFESKRVETDNDEDDDIESYEDGDEDSDDIFEDIDKLYQDDDENLYDDEDDFETQSQKLSDIVNRAIEKHAPISKHVMPGHSLWTDEKEFIETVMLRMERLIKSDWKMGQRGAEKKAEAYLEAVRDTNDFKMIQVYERLVYEMKNISPQIYRRLKKQLCIE